MSKFVATADWHIGIKKEVPLDWQVKRYNQLFYTIIKACKDHNADLLLAGDLLDKASPSLVELNLFLEFIHLLNEWGIRTTIISGNHCDLGENLRTYDYLHLDKIHKEINVEDTPYNYPDCIIVPVSHCNLGSFDYNKYGKEEDQPYKPYILLSHIRGKLNQYILEEFPLRDLSSRFDLVVLGDIHAPVEIDGCIYTNQPLNSQYETTPDCSFLLIEVKHSKIKWERIKTDLPNLVQKSCVFTNYEQTLSELEDKHFYKITVSGTESQLRTLPNRGVNFNIVKQLEEEVKVDFSEEIEVESPEKSERNVEAELIKYMESIGIGAEKITKLVEIGREV